MDNKKMEDKKYDCVKSRIMYPLLWVRLVLAELEKEHKINTQELMYLRMSTRQKTE